MLEDLHAGTSPSSASGDYSDVTVSSPYGAIPWLKVSRLNDDEMKRLMIDVVDRTYRFIHTLFDEDTGGQILLRLAERDPLPQWNEPTLSTTGAREPACTSPPGAALWKPDPSTRASGPAQDEDGCPQTDAYGKRPLS